jgi:integrase
LALDWNNFTLSGWMSWGNPMTTDTRWRWPLNLANFDITSPLTRDESQSLAELLALYRQPGRMVGYADIAQKRLPRLVVPIRQALSCLSAVKEFHSPVVYRFLQHTAEAGKPYGCFTEEAWLPLLQTPFVGDLTPAVADRINYPFLLALYGLRRFWSLHRLFKRPVTKMAYTLFGRRRMDANLRRITQALASLGYGDSAAIPLQATLSEVLLVHRSPHLADIDADILEQMRQTTVKQNGSRFLVRLSYALFGAGALSAPLSRRPPQQLLTPPENTWAAWVYRWEQTSTLSADTRKGMRHTLSGVGTWLKQAHPDIVSPEQWDRQLCLNLVKAVTNLHVGEWNITHGQATPDALLRAGTRLRKIYTVRRFFLDLQDWGWIAKRFNPRVSLAPPAHLLAQVGPDPRVIAREIWSKLLHAALTLTDMDIQPDERSQAKQPAYPLEMVRAVALVWVFGGLRSDEIRRLRVGCVRWELLDEMKTSAVVMLRVPPNKTSGRFEKPVSRFAAEAIREWEALRPPSPPLLDPKTGEQVDFLFVYRGRRFGQKYLNHHLIPLLCEKAGVPLADTCGTITSHRARATISSDLTTGENAMTLFELQTWLGHRSVSSTLHYAHPTLTRVTEAYTRSDYFERNLRLVDVLVDQDAVRSGETVTWMHYDLGHGYCTHDFFAACIHRMACARCTFYLPKSSSQAQMLEARTNLRRMMQEIVLTDEETAAVEGDIAALERLVDALRNQSTPDQTLTGGSTS